MPAERRLTGTGSGLTRGLLAALLLAVALLLARTALGTSLSVTTTSDVVDGNTSSISALLSNKGADGQISLREAVLAANNTSGSDSITVPAGTYTLSQGTLTVSDTLTITGAGMTSTVINGNGNRIFSIGTSTLQLATLRLTGGGDSAGTNGAAISKGNGSLTLTTVQVDGNGSSNGSAGGIYSTGGSITISGSTFSSNTSNGSGGAINASSTTVSISSSTFSSNASNNGSGGAVYASGGSLTVSGSTFSSNTGNAGGGAFYLQNTALNVDTSSFSSNSSNNGSGGAIYFNGGALSITGSSFASSTSGAAGGAVFVAASSSASVGTTTFTGGTTNNSTGAGLHIAGSGGLTLTDAEFEANRCSGGGGCGLNLANTGTNTLTRVTFYNNTSGNSYAGGLNQSGAATTTATNITVYSNSANSGGGGVSVTAGTLTLVNATVASNSGGNDAGGIGNSGGTLRLLNTLIAGNSGNGSGGGNCSGTMTSLGYNLDSGNGCNLNATGDLKNATAGLGSFGNNGGSTRTLSITSSSAAVNKGTSSGAPTTDQRGYTRSGATDIGAYEYSGSAPVSGVSISGTVFEDINYGGGSGRSLASASGAGLVSGATVELYSSGGVLITTTTTDSSGAYSFTGLATSTTYHVRVVSSTVMPTRPCNNQCGGTLAALTYRAAASSGTVSGVTNFVGGTNPAVTDPGAASSGATFNTSTYAYTSGLSGTAHAATAVQTGSSSVAGIDFGFSFNLVVNVNDSGQGSLRQYIANANEIQSTGIGMAQVGLTANIDNAVFMIGNGSSANGLRSTLNYMDSAGYAVIRLSSALPQMLGNVLDARRQPGWTSAPLVVLDGSSAGSSAIGLSTSGGTTIAGFVVQGFSSAGIYLVGGGNVIKANYIGLAKDGRSLNGNGYGVYAFLGSADQIGGTTSADRNVIAASTSAGVVLSSCSGTLLQGNYIGTQVDGVTKGANGKSSYGGVLVSQSSGVTIGGTASGAGNVIAGNDGNTSADGIYVYRSSGTTIQGNTIGPTADGGTASPNARHGIFVQGSTGTTIGGTASGAANLIQANGGAGVDIETTTSGNSTVQALNNLVSANSIRGNGTVGIDLGGDGTTANDGTLSNSLPNKGMDSPVVTSANFGSGTLTVAGYVGSAASQTTFASAIVEFFVADTTSTSASGQGATYLGSLTADANGNFSGSISGLSGLTSSTVITATARDSSGNTSEFGRNFRITGPVNLSGTVFEDINYGGGAGRNLASATGRLALPGVTVELYDASGGYVSATTTDSSGAYSFAAVNANTVYSVRVVNGTVRSARAGSSASLVPVMTYRAQVTAGGSAVDVTNEVGGLHPAGTDSAAFASGTTLWTDCSAENSTCSFSGTKVIRYGANGGSASGWAYAVGTGTMACSNSVFGDPLVGTSKRCQVLGATVQSLTLARTTTSNLTGLDFGFNFDTVVNTNDSGQGSLRQALSNANALTGDSTLAVSGRTAGVEHLIFMLPNGTNASGLRSAYTAFSSGVATIAPTSALPVVNAALVIDAQQQPGWSANPVVELNGSGAGSTVDGLQLAAAGSTVRGLVINRFSRHGVYASAGSATVQGCWIGVSNAGTAASANTYAGIYTAGSGHVIGGSTSTTRNVLSGNGSYGLVLSADSGSTGSSTVSGNYIGTNAAGTAAVPNALTGLYVLTTGNTLGGSVSGAGNVVSGNTGAGVHLAAGPNTVQGNLIGVNATGTAALGNGGTGLYVGAGTGHTIGGTSSLQRNVISANGSGSYGGGIFVAGGGGNTIQGNYVGVLADGATAAGNLNYYGIELYGTGSNTVGGTAAGSANVVSGQSTVGKGGINIASNGNTVQGNLVGVNASASGNVPNSGPGIAITTASVTGNTIGGTTTGAGNTIAANGQQGVLVTGSSATGNAIRRNAIYGNTGLGIDIASAGRTANNGSKNTSVGNAEMDTPVFTSAIIGGTTLTVSGYVGSAAGQATFAGAAVEIFKAQDDGTGYGQGQVYLGTLTADASGNFSGTLTVSGVSVGSKITATATDGSGNTSEFGPNATAVALTISGTVFEDANYGGGSGRNLASSGGTGLGNVTVELYSSSGSYISSTTTSGGSYSFSGLSSGTSYYVRVATRTVVSARSGASNALLGVLTFRTDASSGSAVDDGNSVGGTNPAASDGASGSSGTAFSPSTWVFSSGLTGTAQAVTPVTVGSLPVSGVDFGFNFDTVVNTNDSGAGSLRQVLTNANTLAGDSGLAVSGRTAGVEHVVFMLPNGSAGNGLRSAYNAFSGGVATITPASALPTLTTPIVIDAQLQPGWASTPVVELNGTSAGSSSNGLVIQGGASTVRGLAINRFGATGLEVDNVGGNTLQGNHLGTDPSGSVARPNGNAGLNLYNVPNTTVGGTGSNQGNVISGNTGNGVVITGSSGGTTLLGNTIGLNRAGTARLANGSVGVYSSSPNVTIGGTTVAARNVISGNTYEQVQFGSGANGSVIQGNYIGPTAAGNNGVANGGYGIYLNSAAGVTVGGTAAGAGNLIYGNGSSGVVVAGNVTGDAIYGNSIYGNGGIGIDLGANGATANDGAKTSGQPNLLMDAPVITAATYSAGSLTLTGYVGSAAGQTTFASARVEVFLSDGSNPAGQGQTYLGFLTADSSGNFSGTLTGVPALTLGSSRLTGTATDASGNTSEFGTNYVYGLAITGSVYEDLNYGGGAGRSKVLSSGGSGRGSARVELYTVASGVATFSTATTTDGLGAYSFGGLAAGSYAVRVVPASVSSSRSGYTSSLLPVLTFRTDASSGTATGVTNAVGGTDPAASDPGSAAGGAAFNTTSGLFTAGLSGTAQAYAPVTVGSGSVAGVDFGFNFDTVVNTNDSGAGSLRQAIANANALGGDSSLAVSGRTSGVEHVVFMLPNGSSAAGLRASLNAFSGGVASIALASGLPAVSAPLVIDAQTQPGWGSTPLVELNGAGAGNSNGFQLTVAGSTVRGFVINRFTYSGIDAQGAATLQGNWIGVTASGSTASANGSHGILLSGSNAGTQVGGTSSTQRNVLAGNGGAGLWINSGTANHVVQGNSIGLGADGNTRVGNTGFYGVEVYGTNVTLGGTATGAGNVISGQSNSGKGGVWLCSSSNLLQGNRIGTNLAGTAAVPNAVHGIVVCGSTTGNVIGGTATGAGNLISGNGQWGVVLFSPTTVQGNTIGLNAAASATLANGTGGIWVDNGGAGSSIGGTASGAGNVISGNGGLGVGVNSGATGVAIQTNTIWSNTGIAIDLGNNGITANDGAKTNNAANLAMDAAVFTSARTWGTTLQVAGYVGSAAGQTTFANARVEVFRTEGAAGGYGGGQVYLGALTADASGNFSGTLTLSAPLAIGVRLSATATDGSGNTSEFGPNFANVVVDLVVNSTGDEADTNAGDGSCATASGVCSLRAALQELNAQASLGYTPTIRFALPSCAAAGDAGCRIAPLTALPSLGRAMTIDGTTQAGFSTTRYDPLVVLGGASAPAGTIGLVVATSGATVRGLAFSNWGSHGLSVSGNGNTVVGSWFGVNGTGTAAAGNGGHGLYVSGSGNTLGGFTPADRLVAAGNSQAGIALAGSGNTLKGSVAGLLPDGQTAAANTLDGVYVSAANQVIGGTVAGEGNVLSGNGRSGLRLDSGSNGTVVYGNLIGVAADGSTARGNGASVSGSGIDVLGTATGLTVGGTAAGQRNVIANSNNSGIGLGSSAVQRVRISGNSVYANGTLGIRTISGASPTANDGATSSSQANNGMDFPVVTGAGVDSGGTSLLVYGYVGTGSGQAAFAGANVEFFKAAPDPTGYGEGKTYLGTLTADANGAFSGTLTVAAGTVASGDSITATATDANGNTSEFGPNWTVTAQSALAPGRFDAFDAATAAGATSGPITSKVAGAAASYAVIALDNSGTGLHPGFTGTVALTWVDARNDSGAATGSCRSSWVDLGAAGTATFSSNNRVTVSLTPPATATRVMRLKMVYSGGGSGTVTACSGDAFAALPASLSWIGASDTDPTTAGTTRSLANTSASGGIVHRAGRPFTVRAQALTATGALMTGYDGSPSLAAAGCLLPSGCTAGTLTAATVSASAGTYTHSAVSYAEVGAIQLQLTDSSYAAVDASDTSASVRTLTSSLLGVGRFVPDAYTLSLSTTGQFATANAACLPAGSGATFLGQAFTWATPPQVTVTAVNAAGATTTFWTGSLMKLTASALSPSLAVSGAGSATLSTSFGSMAVADLGGGQARLTASTTDRFLLDLASGSVQDTTTPTWTWALNLTDASEAAVAGNPTLTASSGQSGIGFNSGNRFYSGRLALQPAYGDVRVGPRALVQLQRYTTAGWVTMTDDQGCVTVAPQNLGLESPSGVFASAGVCAAPVSASVTTQGGRAWLAFAASPGGSPGRLQLRLAGPAATGTACSGAGATTTLVPMTQSWLLGGSTAAGPQAWATWGRPQRDALLRRETW